MKIILATDGTKYGQAAVEMLRKFNLGDGESYACASSTWWTSVRPTAKAAAHMPR